MGSYIWYSEEGPGRAGGLPNPLLTVPDVTAHPSMASVLITVLLYDGPLLCGFNVAVKGLIYIVVCGYSYNYLRRFIHVTWDVKLYYTIPSI